MRTLCLPLLLLALTACQPSTQTQQAAQRLSPVSSAQAAERQADTASDATATPRHNTFPTFRIPPSVPGFEGRVSVGPIEPVL